jgi:hypothetical protein
MSKRCKHVKKDGFNCGSYAFNLYMDDIDQGNLCDVHYWQAKAQRTWVGLTNNELQPIADEYRILFGGWVEDFARAIEAKLKDKNT